MYVLNKQVEEITSGAIPGRAMSTSLSIGVAVSIGLAMFRVMTGISIFYLVVPGIWRPSSCPSLSPRSSPPSPSTPAAWPPAP